jgi:hypothetical protein
MSIKLPDTVRRKKYMITMAPDVLGVLREQSRSMAVPISRVVEACIRRGLGLPEPRAQAIVLPVECGKGRRR